MLKKLEQSININSPPKTALCALCKTEVEIFIGCVCNQCYINKVLPYKKTTLKRKCVERDPNEDW